LKSYLNNLNIKALIIDIDNTLYNNDAYLMHQYQEIVKELALLKKMTFNELESCILNLKDIFLKVNSKNASLSKILNYLEIDIEENISIRKRVIKPTLYLKYDDNIYNSILKLKEKYILVCLSNNPLKINYEVLDLLKIKDFFNFVIGLDSFKIPKPSLIPFKKIKESLNLNYSQILSIGDRYEIDIDPLLNLGGNGLLIENIEDFYNINNTI